MTTCLPHQAKGVLRVGAGAAEYMGMAALADTKIDVTVVRALIESEGRTLLVRRARWDSLPGRWELPGGKVDRGEPRLEALAREVEEETGLMLASARLLNTREMLSPRGRTVREYVFAATTVGAVSLSREHDAHAGCRRPATCASRTRPRPRSA